MSTTDPIARVRVEPGVWQRGDKCEITWRDAQGKQRRRVVAGGIMAARSALAAEVAKRATGERVAADTRLTFGRAAGTWYDDHVVAHLRPASQSAARSALKHLRAEFGSRRLTAIEPGDVARYVTARRAAGMADNTIRAHVNALSGVYRFATRHLGYPGASPVAALDRRERPTTEPVTEGRALTSDEVARLLGATLLADALLTELTLATGLRMSEALGLTWGDLDLSDTPAIEVSAQLSRYGERGQRVPVKSRRGRRRVVITGDLARKLVAARLLAPRSGAGDYVFTSRVGAPREQRSMCRTFKATITRAGLDEEMVWHWLRHTHASQLIAAGWTMADVAARLGDSIQTVMATYAHEFDAARREDEQRAGLAALAAVAAPVAARAGTKRTLRAVAGGAGSPS
jgi:integrase